MSATRIKRTPCPPLDVITESFLNLPPSPMPRHFPVIFPSSETRTSRIEKTSRTSHSSRQSHSSCKGSSDEGERGFETTHGRVEGFGLIRQVTGFRQGRGRKPLRSFRACHERGNKHLGSMGAKLSRTSSAEVRYLKPIGKPRFPAFFFFAFRSLLQSCSRSSLWHPGPPQDGTR